MQETSKPLFEWLGPTGVQAYLVLVEEYAQALANPPRADEPTMRERQAPTFAEFLESRHQTALAQIVRSCGQRESSDKPLAVQIAPHNNAAEK